MTAALRSSTPHVAAAHRAERFRLLHITTIPMSLVFLRGQVAFMQERGLEIEVASSPGPELEAFGAEHGIRVTAVPMQRRIAPRADVQALAQLRRLIRRFSPHILHVHTPKAGLLGTLAGALERVPFRIYHMRGLPLMGHTAARRQLLRITERLSCAAAHRVLCVSRSLRDVAIAERLCDPAKITVLAGGSGNGVDAAGRFDPSLLPLGTRAAKRAGLRVPEHATVIGFIGRIVRDKGIIELTTAWQRLRDEHTDAYLLLVGPPETEDPVPAAVLEQLRNDPRVRLVGEDWNTPPLYMAMDLVVLPTYREGFPNVPLEAAAMRLPVVATRVPGCIDAVEDGKTGILVPPRDAESLAAAMRVYLGDAARRQADGDAGRRRVLELFRQEVIWEALYEEYESHLRRYESGPRSGKSMEMA